MPKEIWGKEPEKVGFNKCERCGSDFAVTQFQWSKKYCRECNRKVHHENTRRSQAKAKEQKLG